MIRLLVKLGAWLDTRFPEKVVITRDLYDEVRVQVYHLAARIAAVDSKLQRVETSLEAANSRLFKVENSAVHKGAVSDVVIAVQALKADVVSLKANLGMNRVLADKELQIMLSGEEINGQE